MQEELKDKTSDDFISLATIKRAVSDFFRVLFKVIDYIAGSVRSNIIMFLVCCLLCISLSYLIYKIRPKYYSTEMIVIQNELTKKDYSEIIKNLNNLVAHRSFKDLAVILKTSEPTVNKIESIEAFDINNESLEKDTSTKIGQPFKIQFKFKEIVNTDTIQSIILNYLNNNSYASRIIRGEKEIMNQKLEFINNQLQKLDSLKTIYNSVLSTSRMPSTFYNNAMDPADVYNQSFIMANEKENILKWLNNKSQAVMVVDNLKTPILENKGSLKLWLAIGLLAGILLGIILSLLFSIRRSVVY
jgi:hypothetical protein